MSKTFHGFLSASLAVALAAGCNGSGPTSRSASSLSSSPSSPTVTDAPLAPTTPSSPSSPSASDTPSSPPASSPPPTETPPPPVVDPRPLPTTLPAPPAGSAGTLLSKVASFTPPENPTTAAKVTLGKALFWDEQLGARGTQACASCHSHAGADPRALNELGQPIASSINPGPDGAVGTTDDIVGSMGVIAGKILRAPDGSFSVEDDFTPQFFLPPNKQVTGRNTPTAVNAIFNKLNFWDGRASNTFTRLDGSTVCADNGSAESQAVGPPLSPVEMGCNGQSWEDLTLKVSRATVLATQAGANGADIANVSMLQGLFGRKYTELFERAFGDTTVTRERIGQAIAAYERTLISDATPFDRFQAGDQSALTAQQQDGLGIFKGKGNCTHCHSGLFLSDAVSFDGEDGTQGFHRIGVRPASEDHGRMNTTNNPSDDGKFKTPQLRNVKFTAPYFHTGGKATLEQVVDFYNGGGDFANDEIHPLGLSPEDKAALVEFLRNGLADPNVGAQSAPFDHPPLH